MSDRSLLLVLVLHLAAFAVALSDSPKARQLSVRNDAGSFSSSVPAPLQTLAPPTRRVMDGAPVGGAPECPCLPMDSPKFDHARAALLLKGLPVRSLLPRCSFTELLALAAAASCPPRNFSQPHAQSEREQLALFIPDSDSTLAQRDPNKVDWSPTEGWWGRPNRRYQPPCFLLDVTNQETQPGKRDLVWVCGNVRLQGLLQLPQTLQPRNPNPDGRVGLEPNPKPQTPNPKPQTPHPKPQTPHPELQTPNPKP